MNYTTKEEYQEELKTFMEIYLSNYSGNEEIEGQITEIIAWYKEQIALIERIDEHARKYLTDNTANQRRVVQYP